MRQFVIWVGLWTLCLAGAAVAQDSAWVQVEAQPTLGQAETRAGAYAAAFGNIVGFRMASGWYAIVLGPYAPDEAAARLAELRAENLIPRDSYIASGTDYGGAFYPDGATPMPAAGPVPAAPSFAEPEETEAQSRASEAALSPSEKMDVQAALKAAGFYAGAVDGAIGPGTRDSMAAWQEANGHFPSGILTGAQRDTLLAETRRNATELDLRTVTENEAGIEIALPLALVRFDDYKPPFVHYAEKDGSGVRAALLSAPGTSADLAALYDTLQTLQAVPRTGPRTLGGTAFTVEGTDATGAAYAHAEFRDGMIKGYMLLWDPARADKALRALAAMKRSFRPVGNRALDPGLVALSDVQRRNLMAGMKVRRPALSRSGFFVDAAGAVVTTPEVLEGCRRITLDRDREARVAFRDEALGVALLMPVAPLAPRAVAVFAGPARVGAAVRVAGYSYEGALPAATLTSGTVEDVTGLDGASGVNRLAAGVLPGDAGGPVLDASGAVLGMLMPPGGGDARTLPGNVALIATAARLAARLDEAGIAVRTAPAAPPLAPDAMNARGADLTVLVSCWK